MKITFTRNATLDLKNHFEYLKEKRNIQSARMFRRKIFDRIQYLKTFPRMGPQANEYVNLPVEVRYILEGNHKIFYQLTEHHIFILNITSTSQK